MEALEGLTTGDMQATNNLRKRLLLFIMQAFCGAGNKRDADFSVHSWARTASWWKCYPAHDWAACCWA
jgi:hypothetical protein